MSTTALAAVLAKFAGLNVAGKAVAGLAVAAGAIGGVGGASAVADQFTGVPETAQVAVVEPAHQVLDHADVAGTALEVTDEVAADATAGASADATAGAEGTAVDVGLTGAATAALPDASAIAQQVAEDARVAGASPEQIAADAQARTNAQLRGAVATIPKVPAARTARVAAEAAAELAAQGDVVSDLIGRK